MRRDLRLRDNKALDAAARSGRPILALYILETDQRLRPIGAAQKWWLNRSLSKLSEQISKRGGKLILRRGQARQVLCTLLAESQASAIYWNRRYESVGRSIDTELKSDLSQREIDLQSFDGALLSEPWTLKTGSGGYYRVYSPYWRALKGAYSPHPPLPAPEEFSGTDIESDALEDWKLHPTTPDWSTGFDGDWVPGEDGAEERLESFLSDGISNYKDDRNRPDLKHATSGLSAHLAMGEISPAHIWRRTKFKTESGDIDETQADKFLSELAWRDFSYVLLFHNPDLASENYKPDFNHMPWEAQSRALARWQRGETGYPIVDAGMRQLWQTGWMHNRVRMITASFLTKHLMIDWRDGEKWFWDCLTDADPANNAASWQWVAGSGADAAPYFRIFNPITQGAKFDIYGDYVRTWCPELSRLPNKFLFSPWEAGPLILREAGVALGETYPHPIVDHKAARQRALTAYETLKERRDAA